MLDLHAALRHIYGASAVVAFVSTFTPLWAAERHGDLFETMNLWDATTEGDGSVAVFGVVMLLALTVTLFVAAASPRSQPWVPFVVIVISALALLLLITKPEAGDPDLGVGGSLLFGLSILLALAAVLDFVLLAVGAPKDED